MITDAERHKLLVEWNATTSNYPKDKCIHQLFEEQVERTPNAIAIIFDDIQVTYHELNTRANQLAHYLQSWGVGTETLVGICVERSLAMVVGLLGTFKAGGAYVPLDPTYPPDRLTFMLQDAAPSVVVTQTQHSNLFSPLQRMACLDADATLIGQQAVHNPCVAVTASHLAYVIYTSGSTGQPKGVLLEHGGLCNLTKVQIDIFDIRHDSRVLQLVSPNFDVSISDIAITLCAGATLVLAPQDQLQIGEALAQVLRKHAITHIELTPAVLNTINPEAVPTLRTIIAGGEAPTPELVTQWSQGRRFFNAYGPTETTVCATIMDCATWHNLQQSPPIGRPIANTQVYLLDQDHQPVPIGVAGELYIGGVGVARGYLNRPELTAEKFIANPFGLGRLYKTGDLARWLSDGNIEFLGRIDHQVKLRGFRIELGEIETILSQHPTVQGNLVLAREDIPGKKELVAYVVPTEQTLLTAKDLRLYLSTKLPNFMLPAAFVFLAEFPLTPNGKIDRKALLLLAPSRPMLANDLDLTQNGQENIEAPAHHDNMIPQEADLRTTLPFNSNSKPEQQALSKPSDFPASKSESCLSQTAFEQVIGQVWCDVLALEAVDINDNFFMLGGHSLHLVEVQKKLTEGLSIEIQVVDLLHYPTVHALADHLRRRQHEPNLPQKGEVPPAKPLNSAAIRQEQRRRRLQAPTGQ